MLPQEQAVADARNSWNMIVKTIKQLWLSAVVKPADIIMSFPLAVTITRAVIVLVAMSGNQKRCET